MAPTVVTTAYGREAVAALHAQIVAAKAGEPLTPVTVLVPTNSVGVATRRLLGSGALGPVTARGAGVVGVSFLTVLRLAELLAAPALAAAQRRPVSTPVVAAAVRRVLAQQPGLFAPVVAHPATEEALVAAHRELAISNRPRSTHSPRKAHARRTSSVSIERCKRSSHPTGTPSTTSCKRPPTS
jgi:hypothetical protein